MDALSSSTSTTTGRPSAPPALGHNAPDGRILSGSEPSLGTSTSMSSTEPVLLGEPSAWCTDGTIEVTNSACAVVPASRDHHPGVLLIYLHGIIPPNGDPVQKHKVLSIVSTHASRTGYVALIPKGIRGIGPSPFVDWYAWPTSRAAYEKRANILVAQWMDTRRTIEAKLGATFTRVILAGSSNGAYFLTMLAARGDVDVDTFGAFSGGVLHELPKISRERMRPFVIAYGEYDGAKGDPQKLSLMLDQAKWSHRTYAHKLSHGAHIEYLDDLFRDE